MPSEPIPILLSVVVVVRNEASQVAAMLSDIEALAAALVSDYEIIIIDNGSTDSTQQRLRELTGDTGIANLQVYVLSDNVDEFTATWVGIENSLGDIVACLDPRLGETAYLADLTKEAANGNEIVFTKQVSSTHRRDLASKTLYSILVTATRLSTGINLAAYSTSLIAISRRVVNYLMAFPDPQIRFRNLGSTTGFRRTALNLPPRTPYSRRIRLRESLKRGLHLVTSSSESPLRIATSLSAFGALACLIYSVYIVLIWAFKKDVAPGWVSLSMQQSGMFFLISLVLLILSEYVLEISRRANSGPAYYIANEYTSTRLSRAQRLNVELDHGLPAHPTRPLFRSR